MAKIISLSAVILGCILLARAEPQANSYSIGGENNGFEYNSNIIGGAYMAGKEGHRESTDFYGGGSGGHALTNSRSQGNLEESLRSNSYSGFSPSSSHSATFSSYSTGGRENLASSPYFVNNAAQSNYDSYATTNSNGDSTFDSYTQGSDQVESDFGSIATSKHTKPSYMRYSDNLPGASSTGSYPELGTEGSSFRGEYPTDSFRSHASHGAGYMDSADQTFNREASNLFNSPSSDYSYVKSKDATFGTGGGHKYTSDMYSPHPETRYVRGNHGSMVRDYPSSTFLSNSGSGPYSGIRGTPGAYSSGKFNKYNKYTNDYTPSGGLNYLSKEQQDIDYLLSNYGKGSGKLIAVKEGRPSSYNSQPYLSGPGPSYLSKLIGDYKSKPSFASSYPSSPPGYPSSLHSSYSGNSYAEAPLLRRYRSSIYVPRHPSTHSGYY
ncbi:unnamed protein product [Xylocopa violacea]|uniref:Uncharacterized protein n=1 Tax=Xylocopa violacea TaxID=135666 RepID=A0ABP1NGE2_XYLVO